MKKLFLLFSFVISFFSIAQIPDYFANDPAWSFEYVGIGSPPEAEAITYYINGDTIIDGIEYKLLYENKYSFQHFFGNEKSIVKKLAFPVRQEGRIIYRRYYNFEEILIDYNYLIEDTIPDSTNKRDIYTYKIDSVLINQSFRNRYHRKNNENDYETIHIEGVVSSNDLYNGMFGLGGITLHPIHHNRGTSTSMIAYFQGDNAYWVSEDKYSHYVKGQLSYFSEKQKWSLTDLSVNKQTQYTYTIESNYDYCFDLPFVIVYKNELCGNNCQEIVKTPVDTLFQDKKSLYRLRNCNHANKDGLPELFISYNLSVGDTVKGSLVENQIWIVKHIDTMVIAAKNHLVFSGETNKNRSFKIIEGIGYTLDNHFGEIFLPVSSLTDNNKKLNCYSKNNLTVWQHDLLIDCDYITSLYPNKNNLISAIYPNPANDYIYFTTPKAFDGEINIINFQGKTIKSTFSTNTLDYYLSISELEKGIYILELKYRTGETSHQTFMKE